MALAAANIIDVRTGGNDANAGAFNPANANFPTDGTVDTNTGNTASPVFSSASYNFVTGDIGAWLFIKSGTNSIPGWYQIASVGSNKATLTASAGSAMLMSNNLPVSLNTAAGIATVGTPTGLTWGVDYSQQNSAQYSVTDLNILSTTTFQSSAGSIGKNWVGNIINVTNANGSGATLKRYEVVSTSGTTATVDSTFGTASGTGLSATMGGGLALPGLASGIMVEGNTCFLKYNATAYELTTTTPRVSGGPFLPTVGGYTAWSRLIGYDTTRTVANTDTNRPTIKVPAAGVTSITVVGCGTSFTMWMFRNIIVDGNSKSTIRGFAYAGGSGHFVRCKAANCTNSGFYCNFAVACEATGCATAGAGFNVPNGAGSFFGCWSHDNAVSGFIGVEPNYAFCVASDNTGVGFDSTQFGIFTNCTAWNNTSHGFSCNYWRENGAANCLAVNNGTSGTVYGFNLGGTQANMGVLVNCAGYGNRTANYGGQTNADTQILSFVALTGDPFTNAAGDDFSLNNTAGAGAACRAAGFPGAFPGGTTTGYLDIGAAQHQDAGGGSAGPRFGQHGNGPSFSGRLAV